MLEIMGNLAVENVAGIYDDEKPGAEWRDIGIFSATQWTLLICKCLGSFSE